MARVLIMAMLLAAALPVRLAWGQQPRQQFSAPAPPFTSPPPGGWSQQQLPPRPSVPTLPNAAPLPGAYGAPLTPATGGRPEPRTASLMPAAPPPARPPGMPPQGGQLFQPARILAVVDGEPILEGDVMGIVNQVLEPKKGELTPSQYEQARDMLVRRFLKDAIEIKMLFRHFVGTIPEDNRDKALTSAWQQVGKVYDEEELPSMLEKAKVSTPLELDLKLRQWGYSLAKHRRRYGEKQLGSWMVMQNVERKPEVTYDEMIAYYHEHQADYEFKSRARWEQLTARFDKFPTRQQAAYAIAQMGDAVFYGTPFQAVARRGSQEPLADQGGQHDWTFQGSLVSEPLDRAIFSLPKGKLSPVIEDSTGLHIVRVLEREPAGRTSFEEAQVEIREKLAQEKRAEQMKAFIEKVRQTTKVTTVFDDQGGL